MNEVSSILSPLQEGPGSAEQLLPLVYDELRRLAAQKLAREKAGQTLQATALAWLRQAVAAGYNNAAQLKQDRNLDALRRRAEFTKLVTRLEGIRD